MQIVRTLFWVVLAIALVLFAVGNWQPVEVHIGNGLMLDTKLPLLVIGAFLAGLVPMWAVHRVAIWRLRRRLSQAIVAQTPAAAGAAGDGDRLDHPERPFAP